MQEQDNGPKTPLKFYIAGSFTEKGGIKELMDDVEKRGYQVTTDWTTHLSIKPYEDNLALAKEYSEDDLAGVENCNVFVLVPEEHGGSTQFAELGVAIVTERVKRIFIVGPHNTRSMAFFHPRVERVASLEEVFRKLP